MGFFSSFIERFRRVTYSGRYMPEIDGLRFIAVFLVCFFFHEGGYLIEGLGCSNNELLNQFLRQGGYGVSLFFIISGFILAIPFAEHYLLKKEQVSLKHYYWRRVTRIEPAYIITLILYFIMRVWVFRYNSFNETLPHFFASFFYINNFVYHDFPLINGPAWSLEIEVEFYLLMPLLAYIYLIRSKPVRRFFFILLIIGGCIFSYHHSNEMGNLLNNGYYFICGMFLADLFLLCHKKYNSSFYTLLAILCSLSFFFIPAYYISVWFCLLKILMVSCFFFLVLFNNTVKKILSFSILSIIGGMCYSIYLLHMGILGILRHSFVHIIFSRIFWINAVVQYFLAVILILIVSGIFFLLVEKPTMRRNWYKGIFSKRTSL